MGEHHSGRWKARGEDVKLRVEAGAETLLATVDQRPWTARLYGTIRGVIRQQSEYRLSLDAAGAAFWLVIALFPAVIAAITVFGLVSDPATLAADVKDITRRAPNSFGAVLAAQAEQVAATDVGSLSLGLLVSLLATLWTVSSGGYALFRAIREAYGLPPQNYVVARARAFAAAVAAVVVVGIVVVGAAVLIDRAGSTQGLATTAVVITGSAVAVLGFMAAVMFTFRFSIAAPAPLRSMLPGALLATGATVALGIGVAAFGSWLGNYQAIYGALSGMIVTLLSVYVLMYVLLLCAVFNAQWEPLPRDVPGQLRLPE